MRVFDYFGNHCSRAKQKKQISQKIIGNTCANNTFKFEYCKVYIDPTARNAHFCSVTRCINVHVFQIYVFAPW